MATARLNKRTSTTKLVRGRLKHLERGQIVAVVAAGDEVATIGQHRRRVARARNRERTNLVNRIVTRIKSLDACKATAALCHSAGEQNAAGWKGRCRMCGPRSA